MEEGVPGHGEQGHPGGDSVPDLRGSQLPGGGGDLLHAAQPGAGGRGGQEVRGGRHLDQPPQPQVSCDWWTAGHVTTILISDWINRRISPNIIGLFVAGSSDAVKRAWFYCR